MRLGITKRHLNRLILKYKQEGKIAFQYGNRHRKPSHSIDETLKEKIIQLYNEKYSKFNFTHFTEKLNDVEEINCSHTTVSMILKAHHIISPKAWRKTKNTLIKQLKHTQKKKEGKILLDKIDTLDISLAHPSRPRKNILVNKYKWMVVFIIGLVQEKKPHFMSLLMMPLVML